MNEDVSRFLDEQNHPLRREIEALRQIILQSSEMLEEGIKWNGPNYSVGAQDRLTMRIQPPKQIQLIFHRGAKVKEQPKERLIQDGSGLLVWKENDRAVATFKDMAAVTAAEPILPGIVKDWIVATIEIA